MFTPVGAPIRKPLPGQICEWNVLRQLQYSETNRKNVLCFETGDNKLILGNNKNHRKHVYHYLNDSCEHLFNQCAQ